MPDAANIDITELIRQFFAQLVDTQSVEKTVPAHVDYDWDDSDDMTREMFEEMLQTGT